MCLKIKFDLKRNQKGFEYLCCCWLFFQRLSANFIELQNDFSCACRISTPCATVFIDTKKIILKLIDGYTDVTGRFDRYVGYSLEIRLVSVDLDNLYNTDLLLVHL